MCIKKKKEGYRSGRGQSIYHESVDLGCLPTVPQISSFLLEFQYNRRACDRPATLPYVPRLWIPLRLRPIMTESASSLLRIKLPAPCIYCTTASPRSIDPLRRLTINTKLNRAPPRPTDQSDKMPDFQACRLDRHLPLSSGRGSFPEP